MRDFVTSIAAGKIDGKIVVDLFQDEDNFGEADLPIAIIPRTGEITLLQLDGDLTTKELKKGIDIECPYCKELLNIKE